MRVIVTGTDTGIGKTVVAAGLTHYFQANYWKPLQTGTADGDDDTKEVQRLTGLADTHFLPPFARFAAPLSPAAAAAAEGITIRTLPLLSVPHSIESLVIEGAGGVLVPVNRTTLMIDLYRAWKLPVVVVARTTLGTINHTLLTLEALRQRDIPVLGVVLNGEPNASNRAAIIDYGKVAVLAEIPPLSSLSGAAIASFFTFS